MRISDWSSDVCSSDLPGAFRTIIAASPSIWWDNQAILSEERAFKARIEKDGKLVRGTLLVLIAGEREQDGSIAGDTAALGRRLRPRSGFGLRTAGRAVGKEWVSTCRSRVLP